MRAILHKIVVFGGYAIALMVILAALAVSITRLLTPVLDHHRKDFEYFASLILKRPVTIEHVHVSWRGYEPELTFEHVILQDNATKQAALEMAEIRMNLSVWRSLMQHQFIMESLKIVGVHVTLQEQHSGQVHVNGIEDFAFSDDLTGGSIGASETLSWLFMQPSLFLEDIDIRFITMAGVNKSVTLDRLILTNSGSNHVLYGKAILNQDVSTSVSLRFGWQGDVTDLPNVSADCYLYLEGLSLSQWFEKQTWNHLQIQDGLGSIKIWAKWNHNAWQKIQTSFQFYGLNVESLLTKKSVMISRINGDLGWKREGQLEVIAGDDLLIDFPGHLWPVTNFSVVLSASHALQNIHVGYLDIPDIYELAEASGFFPETYRNMYSHLNLQGELRDVDADAEGHFSGEFDDLSFDSWNKYPSVAHLHGLASWDGMEGKLKIDSMASDITISQLFSKPLQFDQLSGYLTLKKINDGSWTLAAKDCQAQNADVKARAHFAMVIPPNQSPTINLSAGFSLLNASHVVDYLPTQIFDSKFVDWMKTAFISGHMDAGQVVVKGNLKDFPFDQGQGSFIVSGIARDFDFNYAPGWPSIRHAFGTLIFSGRSMVATIDSGKLLDAPISLVRGEIPYIGDAKPQILTITGLIQSDLSGGLRFIHESPMQTKLGKELSGMKLQGPMQLKLSLVVPIAKPEKTAVIGDTNLVGATLTLPEWNIALQQLTGGLHFTENTISTTVMQGRAFDAPATLTLSTEQSGKTKFVKASLQSSMSIPVLESWLGLPLSQVLQGDTAYDAELDLFSSETHLPTQVILRSQLKGLAIINIPAPYGKNAEELRALQLNLELQPFQPVKARLSYDKLLTAAMLLQKSKDGLQLVSGNLNLGAGSANWQTQPGWLVTGQFEKLDWESLAPSVTQFLNNDSAAEKPQWNTDLVRAMDIRVNMISAFGQIWSDTRLQIQRVPGYYQVDLNNSAMAGQILFPIKKSQQAIQAKFQRFYFSPAGDMGSAINPAVIPAFSFIGNDVRFGDKNLGHVVLGAQPDGHGLAIKQLIMESSAQNFHAAGSWQASKGRSHTHLQGDIETPNVSDFLKRWNLTSENLVGSKGDMHFDLNWQDAPYHPTLAKLTGDFSINLGKGRIINLSDDTAAKMGIGRLLNILSLQSIPRRLSLDFSDLFEKGYSFDYMKGDFSLKNGNANTKNTRLDGPVARVDLTGRIGLMAKDYNIILSVTPYVTSSLPVVATILAANPLAGIATWAVAKVVNKEVSKVTTYQYTITGSWDNPVWQQTGTGLLR